MRCFILPMQCAIKTCTGLHRYALFLIVLSMLDFRAHAGRQSFVTILLQKMAFVHVSRIRPWQESAARDRSRHWPSLVLDAEHHRTGLPAR